MYFIIEINVNLQFFFSISAHTSNEYTSKIHATYAIIFLTVTSAVLIEIHSFE